MHVMIWLFFFICSGYEVQFHMVDEKTPYADGLPRILPKFLKSSGPLTSLEKALENPKPVSFYIPYEIIPENITIGDELLGGALKNGVKYTIVTVVYTKVTVVLDAFMIVGLCTFIMLYRWTTILKICSILQVNHHNPLQLVSDHILVACIQILTKNVLSLLQRATDPFLKPKN